MIWQVWDWQIGFQRVVADICLGFLTFQTEGMRHFLMGKVSQPQEEIDRLPFHELGLDQKSVASNGGSRQAADWRSLREFQIIGRED